MINILLLHTNNKSISSIEEFCSQVQNLDVNIQVSTDAFSVMQLLAKQSFDIIAVDIDDISIDDALYYYDVWGVKYPLLLVADDVTSKYTSFDLPENTYAADKEISRLLEVIFLIKELPLLSASIDIVTVAIDGILADNV